ncbi:MAG TPA: hypothetical protein VGS80_07165, partial [Ktedonobacterales bacterium]|nr:hypothetical protein [Ktedonobacterales bacterium]
MVDFHPADLQQPDQRPHQFIPSRKRTLLFASITAVVVLALAAASAPALAAVGADLHAATSSHTHSTVPAPKTNGSTVGSQSPHVTAPAGSAPATPAVVGNGSGVCPGVAGYASDCRPCPPASIEPSNPVQCSGCPVQVGVKH